MCGLVGLYLPDGATPVTLDVEAMLARIRHRGPDGIGIHRSADGRYQAGFTRLAIIDLESGDQPIVEDGGRRVLTGNGEIYNYVELRQSCPSYPWQTRGDIETVLPLADRKGDDFVHDLNGMYALALYERDRHRLVLVRDRLGVKPLYYARLPGGGLLFASEIKALFASGLVRPRVDEQAVADYLAHSYVPAPSTLYAGIAKLPPGCRLVATRDGAVAIERYWSPRPADMRFADGEEAREVMTDMLRDAVRLQLRSDVPVGALLSGGLDSGLLVALAATQLDRPLSTFTVRFPGAAVDEAPLAEAVARRYGTEHHVLEVDAGGIAQWMPQLAWFGEEPLADAAVLPNHLIERHLSGHIRVVLNGTGGDELFAGYGRYFPLPVEQRYLRLPRALRRGVVEPLAGLARPMLAWQLARAEKAEADPGGYVHDHASQFPAPMRALIGFGGSPGGVAQREAVKGLSGPAQTRMLMADLATYLPEDLLTLLDRTSMAASVEGRVPFLDHRLVEAALAVPPHLRTPGGRQKGLERAMAAPLLPPELLSAPKQGFVSPIPHWLRQGLAPLAHRLLTRKATLDRGWWTRQGIERLLADPDRHGYRVYTLLALEVAVRIHAEADHSAPPTLTLADLAESA